MKNCCLFCELFIQRELKGVIRKSYQKCLIWYIQSFV